MNIEYHSRIMLFQNLIKTLTLKQTWIIFVVFAFQEIFITYLFKPRTPCRHKQDKLIILCGSVLKNIPSCKSCNRSLAFWIIKILDYYILLKLWSCGKICHRTASFSAEQRSNLFKRSNTMLEEENRSFVNLWPYQTCLTSPCIQMCSGIRCNIQNCTKYI